MRRTVAVALVMAGVGVNRIVLQHRDSGAPSWPNSWTFFGGGIEEGEFPIDAARRELIEETDLLFRKSSLEYVGISTFPDEGLEETTLYVVRITPKHLSKIRVGEGDGFGVFNLDLNWKISPMPDHAIFLLTAVCLYLSNG